MSLVDMLMLDRAEFEKSLSLSVKKKIKIETKWEISRLGSICEMNPSKKEISNLDENLEASFIEMSSVSNDGKILFTAKIPPKFPISS